MEGNVVELEMDRHLQNVEREAKMALQRFEESGIKISNSFIKHFQKMSNDRLVHTCERYTVEAKFKTQYKQAIPNVNSNVRDFNSTEIIDGNAAQKRTPEGRSVNDKSKRLKLQPTTSVDRNDAMEQQDPNELTVLFCAYCQSGKEPFSGTIGAVHTHWLCKHANESLSKPFRFYAADMFSCFHCHKVDVYNKLVKHHKEGHSGNVFAIVDRTNRNECGICKHEGGDILEHSKDAHDLKSAVRIFNPVYYSDETIVRLSSIQLPPHENLSENQNVPTHLICDYCRKDVNRDQLLNHFKEHAYNFYCSECLYQSADMAELAHHKKTSHDIDFLSEQCSKFPGWVKGKFFKTIMCFANGLALNMYNVQGTKFDVSKQFDLLVEAYLDANKKEAERMIELSQTSTNSSRQDQDTIQTATASATSSTTTTATTTATTASPKEARYRVKITSHSTSIPLRETDALKSFNAKLNKQQKLAKEIFISGIPSTLNEENLYEIIMALFGMHGISVSDDDIEEICQHTNGVVVRFWTKDVKMGIIHRAIGRIVWSNNLIQQADNEVPSEIIIDHHLTEFYAILWIAAVNSKLNGKLFSCKMQNRGLVVKKSRESDEQVIQSIRQLDNVLSKRL